MVSIETMKRKSSLVEVLDSPEAVLKPKVTKQANFIINFNQTSNNMYRNTIWFKDLINAEKTCLKEDKTKKIHYKFDDNKEMVEEYNLDTQVLLRRAWKVQGKLGGEGKWMVEIGDPLPDSVPNMDSADIMECKDQPVITTRNTRVNIEWRIRNLPYPIETYSIKADNKHKNIIISTLNKKYYKKLEVLELTRLGLPLEEANIQATHKFNTLIILYKKPQQLLDMEKELYEVLKKVKPVKDIPSDCKMQ